MKTPPNKLAAQRRWKTANPTKCREVNAEWYKANKDHVKRYQRLKRYGITLDALEKLLQKQDGKCPICGVSLTEHSARVDHDHATKEIRGLLCHTCNLGLGHFHDSTNKLMKAVAYLESLPTSTKIVPGP